MNIQVDDVLETKKGVVGETYQGCSVLGLGDLPLEFTKELPMKVSYQYLTFTDTSGGSIKWIGVDRRTLKLEHYAFPKNMSCKLNDISDDFAI